MIDLQTTQVREFERELLQDDLVGGVILFGRNIESPMQLQGLCAEIRRIRPGLLIAVDQEGGRVQRLRKGWTRLPPMRVHGNTLDVDRERALREASEHGWLMATEVLAAGIDLSFAPVLDVDAGISEVIGDRALASDPDEVVELALAFIHGMHEGGMAAVGKHFPGHGHVAADSHLELPDDSRGMPEIEAHDLIVFARCADRLDGIMPAHVRYSSVDARPAGFSRYWLQDVLRQRLRFDGVIFSDDLSMAGAAVAGDIPARVQAAMNAGCDCLLVCNDPAAARQARDHLAAVGPGQGPVRPLARLLRPSARSRAVDAMGTRRWREAVSTMERLAEVCI